MMAEAPIGRGGRRGFVVNSSSGLVPDTLRRKSALHGSFNQFQRLLTTMKRHFGKAKKPRANCQGSHKING